ncbi:MAG: hypothetical protein Q9195_003582 [Heterodermia aff. obscurata]
MSGTEAFAVLGIISSIITIVTNIKKVHDAATDRRGLPKTFREAVGKLSIVETTLNSAKQPFEKGEVDEASCQAVIQIVEACQLKVQKLDSIIQKTIPGDGASRLERYRKSVKVLGKGNKVEDLMKAILEDVQLLAGEHCMRVATASQQTGISKAITDISALPSSVPEHIFQDSGFAATNFGSGTQANAQRGNIALGGHIAHDTAKQYIADCGTMNIETSDQSDYQSCLSAVFLTDPNDDREWLKQKKGSRVDGTCMWINGHEAYKSWLSTDSELLWLSGGPGKGKTMISIYLVEELEQRVKRSENTILLQYFCDNKDERRNTATAILRGLIFQLLRTQPGLLPHILPSYQIQKESLFLASSFQTLWTIFEAMLRDPVLGKIYCVLDGMDECEKDSLSMILDKFRELFRTDPRAFQLNLIIASRDEPKTIPQLLSGFSRIRLDPDADKEVNQDIDWFIEAKVNELSTLGQYPQQLSEYIRKIFRKRAQGTFLWVGIVANELRNCSTTEVVKHLDLFPPGLDEVYARILLQIEQHRRETAARLLRWIVMAVRPLTLAELSVAIGTSVDPSTIHFTPTEIAKDRISWCGNFLTIIGDQVNLIHQSAKDYLLREDVDTKTELEFFRVKEETANLEIASKCFYYLQEGALADGPVDLKEDKAHLNKFPLLSYAVINWPIHAMSLTRSVDMFNLSNPFYHEESEVRRSWLATYCKEYEYTNYSLEPSSPLLHIVSYFGVLPLVENLLSKKKLQRKMKRLFSLNGKGRKGTTALHLAVAGRQEKVVRLLLNTGVGIDKYDARRRTPLYTAARFGDEIITRLLLQAGADTEVKCFDGDCKTETALHAASLFGHKLIVRVLLENGADIDAKDDHNRTALVWAVFRGHEALAQLLLDKGADIEAKADNNFTALHLAAFRGHTVVVQLLLDHGANIEIKDEFNQTALHVAAWRGHTVVVQLLLDHGANIEAKDDTNKTALQWAACFGYTVVVQLLLDHGADIEAQNAFGETALHCAVDRGFGGRHEGTVRLLLDHGADIEASNNKTRTALHLAVQKLKKGDESIVQLLLEKGANIGATDLSGMTPLDIANRELLDGDLDKEKVDEIRETKQAVIRLLSPHG